MFDKIDELFVYWLTWLRLSESMGGHKSQEKEKICKHCSKGVVKSVDCVDCATSYHPSCAQQAGVMNKDKNVVCCANRGIEVRMQHAADNNIPISEGRLSEMLKMHFQTFEKQIKEEITDLKKSAMFISEAYEEQKKMCEEMSSMLKEVVKENDNLKRRISALEDRANWEEQKARERNVVMTGMSCDEEEKPEVIVNKILTALKLDSIIKDITECRFLAGRKGPILVKFGNRQSKIEIFKRIKITKGIRESECNLPGNNRVFVNDDLTRANQVLFKEVRKLKKDKNYRAAYCVRGQIYLVKSENEDPIRIRSVMDIEKLK